MSTRGENVARRRGISSVASYKRAARAECAADAACGRQRGDGTTTYCPPELRPTQGQTANVCLRENKQGDEWQSRLTGSGVHPNLSIAVG